MRAWIVMSARNAALLPAIALAGMAGGCDRADAIGKGPKMQIEEKGLQATVELIRDRVRVPDDLALRVHFTNRSSAKLRLNGMFLDIGTVLVTVRDSDGQPIPKTPPPVPPIDDGQIGRVDLPPGGSEEYVYLGSDFLGEPLPPGRYQIRFAYENLPGRADEWTGKIDSGWLDFEVLEPGDDTEAEAPPDS